MSQISETESNGAKQVSLVPLRLCNKCLEIKTTADFNKRKHICKPCGQQYDKDRDADREIKFRNGELKHPNVTRCRYCDEFLPAKYFLVNYHYKTGYVPHCKYHAAMRSIINKAKKKVIQGVEDLMTRDEFFKILDGVCYYCGTNDNIGVDRISSDIGYTKANCISCCSMCNYMKNSYTIEDFISQCQKVAAYQKVSMMGM